MSVRPRRLGAVAASAASVWLRGLPCVVLRLPAASAPPRRKGLRLLSAAPCSVTRDTGPGSARRATSFAVWHTMPIERLPRV